MTEDELKDKIKELESKNTELKNENADRRIKVREMESQVKELTSKLESLEKEKSDLENAKGNESEQLKLKDSKIKELEKQLKEFQTIVDSYKEQEQKEIESIKSKIPENIREKFMNINDKLALQEIAGMYSERKPNSPLSDLDNIISIAKSNPTTLTVDQRKTWYDSDPTGYGLWVKDSMKKVK